MFYPVYSYYITTYNRNRRGLLSLRPRKRISKFSEFKLIKHANFTIPIITSTKHFNVSRLKTEITFHNGVRQGLRQNLGANREHPIES